MCGLRTICHGSTQTPGLRLIFMFEMLLCPHHVLNEIAALENLIQRLGFPTISFVRFPVRETSPDWSARLDLYQCLRENWTRRACGPRQTVSA